MLEMTAQFDDFSEISFHSYLYQEISERKRKFQLFDFDKRTITKSRNLSYFNGTFVNKFTKPWYFRDEHNELCFRLLNEKLFLQRYGEQSVR